MAQIQDLTMGGRKYTIGEITAILALVLTISGGTVGGVWQGYTSYTGQIDKLNKDIYAANVRINELESELKWTKISLMEVKGSLKELNDSQIKLYAYIRDRFEEILATVSKIAEGIKNAPRR